MITARRRLLFNLDQYESMEIEFIISDIPDDTDPDAISRHLDELMAPEVKRAAVATSRDESDTSVYKWGEIIAATMEGA